MCIAIHVYHLGFTRHPYSFHQIQHLLYCQSHLPQHIRRFLHTPVPGVLSVTEPQQPAAAMHPLSIRWWVCCLSLSSSIHQAKAVDFCYVSIFPDLCLVVDSLTVTILLRHLFCQCSCKFGNSGVCAMSVSVQNSHNFRFSHEMMQGETQQLVLRDIPSASSGCTVEVFSKTST